MVNAKADKIEEVLEVALLRVKEQSQENEFLKEENKRLEEENKKLLHLVDSLSTIPSNKETAKAWLK